MRLSLRPGDSGYGPYLHARACGKRASVTFNGVTQFLCITADSEAGMVVRIKCDAQGNAVVDKDRQAFVDEVLHGKVEIELYDEVTL